MIDRIVFWLTFLVEKIGYTGVALSMFIESFFVPIPSELIMPFAGFVASQGKMNIYFLILLGGFASYLGSLPFYFIGYLGNKIILDKFLKRYGKYFFLSNNDIDRGFEIFNKHGNKFVLFGRIIPVIRSVISFPAGVAKMNFAQFSIYTIIGSTIWSALLAGLGFKFGENWTVIGDYVSRYEHIILILLAISVVVFVLFKILGRKQTPTSHL